MCSLRSALQSSASHEIRRRTIHPALLLTFLSLFITIGASIASVYPYGGVRQCLFLAPGVALIAGLAFADLVQRIKVPRQREDATVAVLGIIVVLLLTSLYRGQSARRSGPMANTKISRVF